MNDHLSGWLDWQAAFAHWTDISISELHGLMSGIMTLCRAPDEDGWVAVLNELSFAIPEPNALTLLTEEAEDVAYQLTDADDAYAYAPLVPDDEHPLFERLTALKHWANGYLTGIGVAQLHPTPEEQILLTDLSKIGGLRPDLEDDSSEGEEAFLHLYEFARMLPVSLSTRPRVAVTELALIAGHRTDPITTNPSASRAVGQLTGAQLSATLAALTDPSQQSDTSQLDSSIDPEAAPQAWDARAWADEAWDEDEWASEEWDDNDELFTGRTVNQTNAHAHADDAKDSIDSAGNTEIEPQTMAADTALARANRLLNPFDLGRLDHTTQTNGSTLPPTLNAMTEAQSSELPLSADDMNHNHHKH